MAGNRRSVDLQFWNSRRYTVPRGGFLACRVATERCRQLSTALVRSPRSWSGFRSGGAHARRALRLLPPPPRLDYCPFGLESHVGRLRGANTVESKVRLRRRRALGKLDESTDCSASPTARPLPAGHCGPSSLSQHACSADKYLAARSATAAGTEGVRLPRRNIDQRGGRTPTTRSMRLSDSGWASQLDRRVVGLRGGRLPTMRGNRRNAPGLLCDDAWSSCSGNSTALRALRTTRLRGTS